MAVTFANDYTDASYKLFELDEPLLRFLWRDAPLRRVDHDAALETMGKAGVLFELQRRSAERRWVMPMRLPSQRPDDLIRLWPAKPEGVSRLQL